MKRLAWSLALVALLISCRKKDDDGGYATEATDSTDVAQNESAILVAASDGADPLMTADQAAQNAANRASQHYQPAACVTATAAGAVVTYTLVDCTGPFGLVHVSGTVVATFTVGADGYLHVQATATGLDVNGGTMDLDARATYAVVGATHSLTVTTDGAGTGPRGNSFTREGLYTVTWDTADGCATLDGDWSTTVGDLVWSTSVEGYSRCGALCPDTGGSISYTGGLSGVTVTITFDGSDVASWETSRGRSGTVDLFCTAG